MAWEAVPPGVWHDDGAYLLLGKSLAEGEGLRYSQVAGSPPGAKFPPVYPLVLAVLWRLAPTAVAEGSLAAFVNLLFVVVGGGLFVSLPTLPGLFVEELRSHHRTPVAHARRMASLSGASLGAALPARARSGSVGGIAPGAESHGTSSRDLHPGISRRLSRATMGAVLGAAVPVALLLRRQIRWAVWTAIGVFLVVAPWLGWSSRAATAIPAPLRDTLGPYGGLADQTGECRRWGVPGRDGVQRRGPGVANRGCPFSRCRPRCRRPLGLMLTLGVAGVGGIGLYRLSRESWTPVLTAGLMVGLLWMWPYQERRSDHAGGTTSGPDSGLWIPERARSGDQGLVRLGASPAPGDGVDGVERPVADVGGFPVRTAALGILGLCWIVWLGGASLLHLRADRHLDAFDVRSRMLARAVLAVEERVPQDGVVGAPELWAGLALHTGRTVAPSARFIPWEKGLPGGPTGSSSRSGTRPGSSTCCWRMPAGFTRRHWTSWTRAARFGGASGVMGRGMLVRLDWDGPAGRKCSPAATRSGSTIPSLPLDGTLLARVDLLRVAVAQKHVLDLGVKEVLGFGLPRSRP